MRVAIMQNHYLPWCGYWEMVLTSDVVVLFDSPQFERKSWQHRQRLKGPEGPIWLRIPVKHNGQEQRLKDVEVDNTQSWQDKHWKTILMAYAKAPHKDVLPALEACYHDHFDHLAAFTATIIQTLSSALGGPPLLERASYLPNLRPGREDHIIDICKAVGADELYDAAGAEAILDPEPFREAGIKLAFQHYEHPIYRQLHAEFVPFMSALDVILNEGPKARKIILSGGKPCA